MDIISIERVAYAIGDASKSSQQPFRKSVPNFDKIPFLWEFLEKEIY